MERRVLLDIQIQDDQAVKNVTSPKILFGY